MLARVEIKGPDRADEQPPGKSDPVEKGDDEEGDEKGKSRHLVDQWYRQLLDDRLKGV